LVHAGAHVARLHATVGKADAALGQAALVGVAARCGVGVGIVPSVIVTAVIAIVVAAIIAIAVVVTAVVGPGVIDAVVIALIVVAVGRRDIGARVGRAGLIAAVAGGRAVADAGLRLRQSGL
jgi:hypothetical protein